MQRRGRQLECARCAMRLDATGDFLDFLQPGARAPVAASAEQRFMESELVARLYERFWRPAFVRIMAGGGAGAATGGFAGELFIAKNSLAMEDREGPWLDLSCGPGLFTRAMAAAVPADVVVGLDISAAMLEVAARRAKGYTNVAFVRADAHRMPFGDGRFGGVNNSGALHAYDDPELALGEVLRVLRPGGVYVGSTFDKDTSLVARAASRIAGIRRFDPQEMHALLSRVGFIDYEDIHLGDSFVFRVRRP
jgi:SAM-dependent methyltransferase